MTSVEITPLPAWARRTKYRQGHPPVFPGGDPTPADRELALALFAELDADSQEWYGGDAFVTRMRERR
jgi:hypothetical protein